MDESDSSQVWLVSTALWRNSCASSSGNQGERDVLLLINWGAVCLLLVDVTMCVILSYVSV